MTFPFGVSPSGQILTTSDEDEALLQQVRLVLSTSLGSRAMRPAFGSVLPTYVFGVVTDNLAELQTEVTESLKRHVPDAKVHNVIIEFDELTATLTVSVEVSREAVINAQPLLVSLAFGRLVEDTA